MSAKLICVLLTTLLANLLVAPAWAEDAVGEGLGVQSHFDFDTPSGDTVTLDAGRSYSPPTQDGPSASDAGAGVLDSNVYGPWETHMFPATSGLALEMRCRSVNPGQANEDYYCELVPSAVQVLPDGVAASFWVSSAG
jgi:hypothetical protein